MENKRIKILGDYYHLSRTQLVEASLARSALEKLDQYSKRIRSEGRMLICQQIIKSEKDKRIQR